MALSLGSPPPVIIRHPDFVEPGLSSIPWLAPGNSGRPADWRACVTAGGSGVNKEKASPGADQLISEGGNGGTALELV